MKKTKLITAMSAFAAVGAITPIAAVVTSCNKTNTPETKVELTKADKEYLTTINEISTQIDGYEGTPHKAIMALENSKLYVLEHQFSNQDFELVFNSQDKTFGILYKDQLFTANNKVSNDFKKDYIWKFVDKYDETSEYPQYLKDNFDREWESTDTLTATTGLDTGKNVNVKKIVYKGAADQKICMLRTNTEYLTVLDTKDTIYHLHSANNVTITGQGSTHYLEYGSVAYIKASNTQISFGANGTNNCSVDAFEPTDNQVTVVNQDDKALVYTKIGDNTTQGKELKYVYGDVETKTVSTREELLAINTSCIVKLGADLDFGSTKTVWQIGEIGGTSWNVLLDLNGHSITGTYTSDSSFINVYNGTLILMDSAGQDSSATITTNQPFTVSAQNTTDKARFVMNSGKIEFTTNKTWMRSALTVGKTGVDSATDSYNGEFYMYGGKITATNTSSDPKAYTPALKTSGKGAYAYIAYGELSGTQGAIVTDECGDKKVPTEGSEIEIVGGTFTTDAQHICINLRRTTKLTIYGGQFYGGTCIGAINSDVAIHGGTFVAYGEKNKDFYLPADPSLYIYNKYLVADGSVIANYWHEDIQALSGQEKIQPKLTVNNAKMISYFGSVLHVGSQADLTPTEGQESWLDFVDGEFYYNNSAQESTWPVGMWFDNETTYNKFNVNHEGTWSSIK